MQDDAPSKTQRKQEMHALQALGFKDVARVRVGKHLVLDLDAASSEAAAAQARVMCDRLLANPVTEDFDVAVRTG